MEKLHIKRNSSTKERLGSFVLNQFKLNAISSDNLGYILKTIKATSKIKFLLLDIKSNPVIYKVVFTKTKSTGVSFIYGVLKQTLCFDTNDYCKTWFLIPCSSRTEGLYSSINILDKHNADGV